VSLTGHSRFGSWLGTEVLAVDAGERTVEVRYQPRDEATNRFGTLAGGVIAAMLDSLTGLAALAALPEGSAAVHRALSVEYLSPAAPGLIRGIGRANAPDGRAITCEGELFGPDGTLVARARAELRVVSPRTGPERLGGKGRDDQGSSGRLA